jgi:hypothetical protein
MQISRVIIFLGIAPEENAFIFCSRLGHFLPYSVPFSLQQCKEEDAPLFRHVPMTIVMMLPRVTFVARSSRARNFVTFLQAFCTGSVIFVQVGGIASEFKLPFLGRDVLFKNLDC